MDVLETLDNLQNAAEQDSEKNKSNNKKSEYHFDKLRMYFGEDYTINNITISVSCLFFFAGVNTNPSKLKSLKIKFSGSLSCTS